MIILTLKTTLLALAIAMLGFSACQQKQHTNVTSKDGEVIVDTLTYETALRYVKNYEKHAGEVDSASADNKPHKKSNSRCIWFSIARMDSLVKKVKREGGDGIRFYLATYDTVYKADFAGHKPERQYWGYNTLVMVSTRALLSDTNKYHWDYYKGKSTPGQNKIDGGFIVGTPPENRGEQCPPPVTCGKIGATLIQ